MGDKNKKEAFHILSHTCFYIPRLPGCMMEVIKYWVICAVSRQICTLLTSVWNYWIDNTCPSLFALVNSLPKREEHVLTPEIVCTIIESIQELCITNHQCWRLYEETQPSITGVTRAGFLEQVTLSIIVQRQTRLYVGKNYISSIFPIIKLCYCWHTSCGFYLIQSQMLITDPGVATKSGLFLPWSIPGYTAWQRSAGKEGEDWLILSSSFMKRVFPKMQTWFYILRKCTLKIEM